ncbi:flagellar hook-associated protein FlgL [Pusillimonas sp. CC-YST705]|uniref:Flagellar hook-associated protein FlgL n=1 Tax=Mesopusillimonas faecipullorum TaxID=2755040 RepID=A0ABS8C9W2_9BURK|nr:flagellar hook-associated protein FlgL [Mesopusillimonas faecipullorum]MCB5362823.1 flagellar hook-associated protein FlgL [Mesopusillimonas faecipullorum]
MRISTSLFFQNGLQTINTQQGDLMHLYQQLGSGRRMVTPADDPLAAAQAINITQAQAINQSHADNRAVLSSNLSAEDGALGSATLLLQDLKTRLVEAGNGTMSDADRASLAEVLASTRDTMMGIANRTDGNGQYLFSGHSSSRPAFDENTGAYLGDNGLRKVQADATRQIAGNDIGSVVFAKAPDGSQAYVSAAAAGNTGSGHIAAPVVQDTQHAWVREARGFTISFQENSSGEIEYVVQRAGESPLPAVPYDAAAGKISLGNGDGVAVQVSFSGQPAAGDAFTVTPASDTDMNMFQTLDHLIAALGTPVSGNASAQANLDNALSSAMQKINLNYDQVLSVRASVGTRLNEIDALDGAGKQRDLGFSNRLSQLEDVDYYTVVSQLQLRSAALEAAAMAFKQIQSSSLFIMSSQ